jgi:hypothetical protein
LGGLHCSSIEHTTMLASIAAVVLHPGPAIERDGDYIDAAVNGGLVTRV